MESCSASHQRTVAKKILNMLRVVYYMIRKGIISKQKLTMDLHLLLKRGKIAGKAIRNLLSFNHHQDSAYSCMSMDPSKSLYIQREVEFSCSSTPSYGPFHLISSSHKRKHRRNYSYDYEAVAAIAKAFEMLNNNTTTTNNDIFSFSDAESIAPSIAPSPLIVGFGKSPRMARQVWITDSPFPIKEDEVANDGKVDMEADEFIKRFYEQLKFQQRTPVATPEYKLRRN